MHGVMAMKLIAEAVSGKFGNKNMLFLLVSNIDKKYFLICYWFGQGAVLNIVSIAIADLRFFITPTSRAPFFD